MSPQKLHKRIGILTKGLILFISFAIAQSYEIYKLQLEKQQASQEVKSVQPAAHQAPAVEVQKESPVTGVKQEAPAYKPVTPGSGNNPTLAQRNKNPLNIKAMSGGRKWVGQIGKDEFGHAVFASWEHGLRAASLTLRSYAKEHQIDTVETLLRRFCTAQGQTFEKYVAFVCQRLGVKRDEKIDLITRMPFLLRAMAKFESGMDLPEELFVSYDVLARL